MTDERDLSQFLYRLTQEIISSRDFSDGNIEKICDKYYANSSYPDKERLRRLVSELKRKLQIQQCSVELSRSSIQHARLEDFPHRHNCPHFNDPHQCSCPIDEESFTDKCVGTQSAVFSPSSALVDDGTQYQDQLESFHTFASTSPCNLSTCTACSHVPSKQSAGIQVPSKQSIQGKDVRNLSEESVNLIEHLLMKHAGTAENSSSEILLRMAAANRALECGEIAGEVRSEFGAGGGASHVPILRQEPEESSTPPTTCCGTSRKQVTRMQPKRKQV